MCLQPDCERFWMVKRAEREGRRSDVVDEDEMGEQTQQREWVEALDSEYHADFLGPCELPDDIRQMCVECVSFNLAYSMEKRMYVLLELSKMGLQVTSDVDNSQFSAGSRRITFTSRSPLS